MRHDLAAPHEPLGVAYGPRRGRAAAALLAWVEVTAASRYSSASASTSFQYAHAAWLVRHGKLPYRDFFEFHFPLPSSELLVFRER